MFSYPESFPNEDRVEEGSDVFFAAMAPHVDHKLGRVVQSSLAERCIDAARWRLIAMGHSQEDIKAAQELAGETILDFVSIRRDIEVQEQYRA